MLKTTLIVLGSILLFVILGLVVFAIMEYKANSGNSDEVS